MDPETVAWGLLAVGVVLVALLVVLVLARLRRLRRARAAVTSDVARRVARLRMLVATRGNRRPRVMRTP